MSNKEKLIKALENIPHEELALIGGDIPCSYCPAKEYCRNNYNENCCYSVMLEWLNATNEDSPEEQTKADEPKEEIDTSKIDKELVFIRMVLDAINFVDRPMLIYNEEKSVVRKALCDYRDKLELMKMGG